MNQTLKKKKEEKRKKIYATSLIFIKKGNALSISPFKFLLLNTNNINFNVVLLDWLKKIMIRLVTHALNSRETNKYVCRIH